MGNLLNRCTSNKLNQEQIFPRFSSDDLQKYLPECIEIIEQAKILHEKCFQAYVDGNFHYGINEIMTLLRNVNALFNTVRPWQLAKEKHSLPRLNCLLYLSLEIVRISAILLEPIVPNISRTIYQKLNIDCELSTWKSAELVFSYKSHHSSNDRISSAKVIAFSKM